MRRLTFAVSLVIGLPAVATAQEHQHSPYAGYQQREVKALSPEDLQAYLTGQGMSLALPGELNGYPGPRHVLDLKVELALTPEQEAEVTRVRERMQSAAIELGRRIVESERQLDRAFAERTITPERLETLTGEIATLQGRLRAVHLQAHLEVTAVLTPAQRERYDHLRGYRTD